MSKYFPKFVVKYDYEQILLWPGSIVKCKTAQTWLKISSVLAFEPVMATLQNTNKTADNNMFVHSETTTVTS